MKTTIARWVGLSYVRLGCFYLPLVFFAYGKLVWSLLLTAEFGLVAAPPMKS